MRDSTLRRAATCALVALLAACSRPEPPDKDQPPEPTAAASASSTPSRQPNVILDAYQRPMDRAKAVEAQVKQAAEEQQAAIEDGGG